MNNAQLTNSESDIPYIETSPTSITPDRKPGDVTYKDVVKVIEQYLASGDRGYEGVSFSKRGTTKGMPNKLKIQTLIQGLNDVIMDCISIENKNMGLQESVIVNDFFKSVSRMSSIIDNVNINVADDKLLCYIIGYMTKLLNNHERYQNKL